MAWNTAGRRNILKKQTRRHFILPIGLFAIIFFSCVKNESVSTAAEIIEPIEDHITEAAVIETVISKINFQIDEFQEKIVENIRNGEDIDNGIDIDKLKTLISDYELESDSNIIKLNGCLYDLRIFNFFLEAYSYIKMSWDTIRQEHIQKLMNGYIGVKKEKPEYVKYAETSLHDAMEYYSLQSEIFGPFFMFLIETLQISGEQYDLKHLPEISITELSLPMTVINIDGIAYESNGIELLLLLMSQEAVSLKENLNRELTDEINMQFDKCVNNVDSYLDWYYGPTTGLGKTWEMFKSAIDTNKTAAEGVQEFMVTNYTEKIGEGVDFENLLNILQQYRNDTLNTAALYASALESCVINHGVSVEVMRDITGDEYMLAFTIISDYLNKIVSEGLPIIGMGNKLDTDGIVALDVVNLVINFIPGVGFIAGIGLDYITLKLTEHWKRPEFKEQIVASIRDTQNNLLEVIRIDNKQIGG
jgi:hypothetical protein